ncbi:MAG: TonB-dependent receptor, partial [Advenella sp.]
SWTRYDLSARYRTTFQGRPLTLRASVQNVLNKKYWLSSSTRLTVATAAAPRTVLLSAEMEF